MDIDLRDGIAWLGAGIGHVQTHLVGVTGAHARLAQAEIGKFECRVAKPIAKGV
jgi:hypothetical protein